MLLPGFPNRRLRATYEEDEANPTTNFFGGILNPEPTIMDMCFTITKRVSIAQSKVGGGPTVFIDQELEHIPCTPAGGKWSRSAR